MQAGAFVGSLVAVLALVAVPVLLLGTVAPYAIRLSVREVGEAGRVSGRLYAISTIGSLVGTFASALLLIPLVGTRRTFLAFAIALALAAVPSLGRRFALAPVALAALLTIPVGTVKADGGRARRLGARDAPTSTRASSRTPTASGAWSSTRGRRSTRSTGRGRTSPGTTGTSC